MISFLLVALNGCAPTQNVGKIPITTKSKEAREYYLKGRELSESLQGQESIEFYKKAIEADPEFALAHLQLAFVQPTFKAFFESLDKAKALVDKVSEGEKLWIMGVDAGVNGFPLKQRENFQKLVEMYPEDERAHNLLAGNYFGQQEYGKAIEEYSKAAEIAPGFSQPHNQLGYAYRFIGNFEEAEKAFKKYIELIPNDPNPYDSYAELLMKMGKYEESIKEYRKALEQNPNFVASFVGIANNLNYMEKHEEARHELQKLYDMARNDGERRAALFAMAVSYVDEGNMEAALQQQQKQYAIAEAIKDASAMAADLIVMGNILLEMGKLDEAQVKYQQAVQTIEASDRTEEIKENTRRFYHYNAAHIACLKGDFELAKNEATEFQTKVTDVNNPLQIKQSHELMGIICLAEEDFEGAMTEFAQANQLNPYNIYRQALVYKGKGDMEKAKEFCEKAAKSNALNNMNQAFIRHKAKEMIKEM